MFCVSDEGCPMQHVPAVINSLCCFDFGSCLFHFCLSSSCCWLCLATVSCCFCSLDNSSWSARICDRICCCCHASSSCRCCTLSSVAADRGPIAVVWWVIRMYSRDTVPVFHVGARAAYGFASSSGLPDTTPCQDVRVFKFAVSSHEYMIIILPFLCIYNAVTAYSITHEKRVFIASRQHTWADGE